MCVRSVEIQHSSIPESPLPMLFWSFELGCASGALNEPPGNRPDFKVDDSNKQYRTISNELVHNGGPGPSVPSKGFCQGSYQWKHGHWCSWWFGVCYTEHAEQEERQCLGRVYTDRRHNCCLWYRNCTVPIGSFADIYVAAMGGIYEFARFSAANLREKDDSLNTALGGFLAGSVLGLRRMYAREPDGCYN